MDDHEHTHKHDHQSSHSQDGVRHTLEILVDAEAMSASIEAATRAYRDGVRLPGFRKGKAPLSMVRQQYGDEIRKRVLDHEIPHYLSHELRDRELQPIDSPELADVDFTIGGPLRFTVRFDTAPQVAIGDHALSATRRTVAVTDEMVDEALEQLRDRNARLVPVADGSAAEDGMFARCQITLLPTGGKGKKLAEEDRYVLIGQEQAIPTLNEQLIGMLENEHREFVALLAEDFPNHLLAGKEVLCRVEVQELKRRQMPEADDDFARDLGLADLGELRQRATEDLRGNLQAEAEREVDRQLLEQLRTHNPVDVPGSLIERRLDEITRRFANDLAAQGVDPRNALDWGAWRRENRVGAEQALAEELLLDRFASDEEIEVEDEVVNAEITTQLENSEGGKSRPLASVVQQMRKDGSYEGLRITMRRRLALERLRGRATIDSDGGENASVSGVANP